MKNTLIALAFIGTCGAALASPYPINHDWAATVVADPTGGWNHYNPGNIPYTFEGWANDIGYLDPDEPMVLQFDHDILDDEMNPYGLDFTVFISFYGKWMNGNVSYGYPDTEDANAVYDLFNDEWEDDDWWRIEVSVSYDGQEWFTCDTLATRMNTAPVFGVPINEDGTWSDDYSDFCHPINRRQYQKAMSECNGVISCKDLNALYKTSAGGISFDLKEFVRGAMFPQNEGGDLAIRYIKLRLFDETSKGYVAIAGASDVEPVEFKITDYQLRDDTITMLGYSVKATIGVFDCSIPKDWDSSRLRLKYMATPSDTSATYLSASVVDVSEAKNGMSSVRMVAPILSDRAAFFRLEYKDE